MSEVYANILNALTSGLYIQVNIALREYLQNAYDAIKAARLQNISEPPDGFHVEVKVTKNLKTITITDNGIGMDRSIIEEYTSIGGGTKNSPDYAGYKGIGKLSGLRFFNSFVVRTKQAGTNEGYELSWKSGDMMRTLLSDPERMKKVPYSKFIRNYYEITSFQEPDTDLHYTQVQLSDAIDQFRDEIDEDKIGRFIKADCPVPFIEGEFEYAEKFGEFLGSSFEPITTYINERVVYRPYQDSFNLVAPRFEIIKYGDSVRAKAWFSWERNSAELIADEDIRGIKFRCKGLSIGNRNLFANNCMKDGRAHLADWFTGEVYVLDEEIKPNTARDAFENSEQTRRFYSEIKKKLGKMLSSCAEARSEIHSAEQHLKKVQSQISEKKASAHRELEKLSERLKNLKRKQENNEFGVDFSIIENIERLLSGHVEKVVKHTSSSENEINKAIEKSDTEKAIVLLLELKEKEVHSYSKDAKKKIKSLIRKTIKQIAEEKTSYQLLKAVSYKEDQIVRIIVSFLDQKRIASDRKEVEEYVHRAMLKDCK